MRESTLVTQIIAALKRRGAWTFKVVGSPYQKVGVPDVLACYKGRMYAFEVKCPGRERTTTGAQWREITRITESGGCAAVVTSVAQVEGLLKHG